MREARTAWRAGVDDVLVLGGEADVVVDAGAALVALDLGAVLGLKADCSGNSFE